MSVTFNAVQKRSNGVWYPIEGSPELNLGNASARQIVTLVLCEDDADLLGLLDPTTAEMRLDAFGWSNWTKLTRPYSDNQGIEIDANGIRGTCRMIDCGRSIDTVREDLYILHQIIEFCHENGGHLSWG